MKRKNVSIIIDYIAYYFLEIKSLATKGY